MGHRRTAPGLENGFNCEIAEKKRSYQQLEREHAIIYEFQGFQQNPPQ